MCFEQRVDRRSIGIYVGRAVHEPTRLHSSRHISDKALIKKQALFAEPRMPPRSRKEDLYDVDAALGQDPREDRPCIHAPHHKVGQGVTPRPLRGLFDTTRPHLKTEHMPRGIVTRGGVQTPPMVEANLDEHWGRACNKVLARVNERFHMRERYQATAIKRARYITTDFVILSHHPRW